MRPSTTSLALFAGAAAAQSTSTGSLGAGSATVLNIFDDSPTLTLLGSDATATTYKNDCTGSAGLGPLTALESSDSTISSASARVTPAPLPRALVARQAMSSSSEFDYDNFSLCEPYTIKQGASTWEFHMTDPTPGVWTMDLNCNWQGAMTAADFTCTAKLDGSYLDATERTTDTTVVPSAEISSFADIVTAKVVGATPTASGSGAAPTSSTGFAPARPLPTGAMALVGGAAGVFAAALAL